MKAARYILIAMMLVALVLILGFQMGTIPNLTGWILIVLGMLSVILLPKRKNKQE